MEARVGLWREDYAHFVSDPIGMVERLSPLKALVGGEEMSYWRLLASTGEIDKLFERVMTAHYDPCYLRSTARCYGSPSLGPAVELTSLSPQALAQVAAKLSARGRLTPSAGRSAHAPRFVAAVASTSTSQEQDPSMRAIRSGPDSRRKE
jgi:hypothetical protein